MKYKVGDKIKFHSREYLEKFRKGDLYRLSENWDYPVDYIDNQNLYNKTFTIIEINSIGKYNPHLNFILKEDNHYRWAEAMFKVGPKMKVFIE